MIHKATADMLREIRDAVMELEVAIPRRFRTLEIAKQTEA